MVDDNDKGDGADLTGGSHRMIKHAGNANARAKRPLWRAIRSVCSGTLAAFAAISLLASCAPATYDGDRFREARLIETPSTQSSLGVKPADSRDSNGNEGEGRGDGSDEAASESSQKRIYAPMTWDIARAHLVGHQGTTALWGACGECCIANTLNLTTGSTFSEADIVAFALERGLCDPDTGGMTLENVADAYVGLLPLDTMDAYGYGGDYAPTIDEMASLLERGIMLNVAVYGEMMREGGHAGEGDVYTTHWIVLHSADRNPDGSVAGFGVIDSASSIGYLTAKQLSDVYYGHDGTNILDPSCVLVYRWTYADGA